MATEFDITDPIPYPLSNPAGVTNFSATGVAYDVALNGYPFFLGASDETPYRRVTAQYRKQPAPSEGGNLLAILIDVKRSYLKLEDEDKIILRMRYYDNNTLQAATSPLWMPTPLPLHGQSNAWMHKMHLGLEPFRLRPCRSVVGYQIAALDGEVQVYLGNLTE